MLIIYEGKALAVAATRRTWLAAEIAGLGPDHPLRRFVLAMARYARDVRAGVLRGPCNLETARWYARSLLIDDEELERRWELGDEALAEHFNVPLEEVAAARLDLLVAVPGLDPRPEQDYLVRPPLRGGENPGGKPPL